MRAVPGSSSGRRPAPSSAASLRAGLGPSRPAPAPGWRAAVAGRGRCSSAAPRPRWPPSPRPANGPTATTMSTPPRRRRSVRSPAGLRIASPERVRRALREPWRVTPGSLVSAVLPAGRRSTAHLRAPYDAMIGPRWPDKRHVDRRCRTRRRAPGRVRSSGRTGGDGRRSGRGFVRDPRLLRARDSRRDSLRRRGSALDHQR